MMCPHVRDSARNTRIGAIALTAMTTWCLALTPTGRSAAQTTTETPTTTSPAPTTGPAPSTPAPTPGPTTGPTTGLTTTGPTTTAGAASSNWTLLFGGDALLTRPLRSGADPFGRIRPPLASADLAIVNVETAISNRGRPEQKAYRFRSAPVFATLLAIAGVDAGSLANNHARDYGADAMLDTVAYLRQAGLRPVGAGATRTDALAPATFTIGTTRVAVLGASQIVPNGGWVATADRPGIVNGHDLRTLTAAVRSARATHDVVVVVMHWGIEGDACPSGFQRSTARALRAAGATAVLGAHPHVLQPVVVDGEGIIAYSLGNFIWDPRSGAAADTGVLELRFSGSTLAGHRFYPHRLDGNGWAASVDPDSFAGRRISGRVAARCGGAVGSARSPG